MKLPMMNEKNVDELIQWELLFLLRHDVEIAILVEHDSMVYVVVENVHQKQPKITKNGLEIQRKRVIYFIELKLS